MHYHWTVKIYSKKPHYHLLAPSFICFIKIHFICPFHRVPNRHPHPRPLRLRRNRITASHSLAHLLPFHHVSQAMPSHHAYILSMRPYHHIMPYLAASAHLHHLHLDFHDSSFNLHPLPLEIQWFLHTITSLVVPTGTDLHLCIGPWQTLQRFHLSSISARVLWDE